MQDDGIKRSAALWARGFAALSAALALAAGGSALAAPTETVLYSFAGSDGAIPRGGLSADNNGNLYGTTVEGGAAGNGAVFKLTPGGTETVLYAFTGGSDGGFPVAGLISDSSGNLYGTTESGGASGFGTVFKLSPGGTATVLHSFTGSDGAFPFAGLIADVMGNLYGTTVEGGASGVGVVFKLSPGGSETLLHSFTGSPSDGALPFAGLIADSSGNLYGTTEAGGASGKGVVFKLSPSGTETVLYAFTGGSDGAFPFAGLIADVLGNLYGTTEAGGIGPVPGFGVLFKLSPSGTYGVLHSFTGSDGAFPVGGLIADVSGNLYGTAVEGGASRGGVVFELSPSGTETVLHAFTGSGGGDGAFPYAGLISDVSGNIYGTTEAGGASPACGKFGCGVVFKLANPGSSRHLTGAPATGSIPAPRR